MVKQVPEWFPARSMALAMGILSVSYVFGGLFATVLAGFIARCSGNDWRWVMGGPSIVLALILLACWFLLPRGGATRPADPTQAKTPPRNSARAVWSLLSVRRFWIACVLSFVLTLLRETFNTWTPVYLHDHAGFSVSRAAGFSAIFPAVGAVSVLVAGWLSDRLGLNGRSLLLFLGLSATAVALLVLMSLHAGAATAVVAVITIGVVAFCLLGPYSYLGGAFALDFGGKQASASSSGIIDGVGYIGGVLAGDTVARVARAYGWEGVFVALAVVSALAAVCAGVLFVLTTKAARSAA